MAIKTSSNVKLCRLVEPYLYLAPATAFLLLVLLYPIVQVIRSSFLSASSAAGAAPGLGNYRLVFADPTFWRGLGNNATLLLTVPVMTGLALVMAVLLFEQIPGWRVYRTIVFLPSVVAVPVIGTAFVYLLGLNGILNVILRGAGLEVH